jgi:hypothetical protein
MQILGEDLNEHILFVGHDVTRRNAADSCELLTYFKGQDRRCPRYAYKRMHCKSDLFVIYPGNVALNYSRSLKAFDALRDGAAR